MPPLVKPHWRGGLCWRLQNPRHFPNTGRAVVHRRSSSSHHPPPTPTLRHPPPTLNPPPTATNAESSRRAPRSRQPTSTSSSPPTPTPPPPGCLRRRLLHAPSLGRRHWWLSHGAPPPAPRSSSPTNGCSTCLERIADGLSGRAGSVSSAPPSRDSSGSRSAISEKISVPPTHAALAPPHNVAPHPPR